MKYRRFRRKQIVWATIGIVAFVALATTAYMLALQDPEFPLRGLFDRIGRVEQQNTQVEQQEEEWESEGDFYLDDDEDDLEEEDDWDEEDDLEEDYRWYIEGYGEGDVGFLWLVVGIIALLVVIIARR